MRLALIAGRRAWIYLVRVAACIGFLHILITVTPVLTLWTGQLSTGWGPETGDTLVVLGSDTIAPGALGVSSYWRTFYATVVSRETHFRRVIVSGKEAAPLMKDILVCQGTPNGDVIVDNESGSTRENALRIASLLAGDAPFRHGRVVLLTSDYHMRRALGALRKTGIEASPLPFPDAYKRIGQYSERWTIFCTLSLETAKLLWYRYQGWI
jgi:uncharacterized SAM-binding protein YcdF (DUF218 family)